MTPSPEVPISPMDQSDVEDVDELYSLICVPIVGGIVAVIGFLFRKFRIKLIRYIIESQLGYINHRLGSQLDMVVLKQVLVFAQWVY